MGRMDRFTNSRKVNQKTVNLVERFEGYETALQNGNCMAYLDTDANHRSWSPGYHGLWTIGWGSTGPDITQGTVWTRSYAEKRLMAQLNQKAQEVSNYVTYPLNENQFGAVVSLAYNVGTAGIHGLLNLINEGRLDDAANAFLEYNHSDGVVLNGLTRRRYAEKELFEWEVPSEVASISPMMKLAQFGKRATAGATVTTAGMFTFIGGAKQVATDNAGWILLGIGCVTFLVFHAFQAMSQTAFDDGTLTPVGTKPVDVVPPEIADALIVPTNKSAIISKAPDPVVTAPVGVAT